MDCPNEWWKAFHNGLWLEAQKQHSQSFDAEAEANFLYTSLELLPGSQVLDVPCSEGRSVARGRGNLHSGTDL